MSGGQDWGSCLSPPSQSWRCSKRWQCQGLREHGVCGLGDPFCLWAIFPSASQGALQGLGHRMGVGLEGWRPGRGERQTAQGANSGQRWVCTSTVASRLSGEEQAGELPAAAVSVHERQGVLCVVLDHGGHGGEELDREAGRQ